MDGRRRFAICLTTLFIAAIVAPSVYAVIVPDVEGQLYPVAEFAITGLGFAVGEVTPLFDDAPVGTVLGQDPEAYLDLPAGTAIDLTVSAGPCACEDFFEQFLDDATGQIIEQSKFEYGAYWVTQAMDDIDPDHSELDEEYYSYYTWDLNEDGIPDYLALELFAHLLCLPDGYPLASTLGIDVAGIKAQFQQNLDEVNLKMDEIALKYIAIRDAVDDAGVIADDMLASGAGSPLDDLISTDAFTTGVIPPYFVGKTYRDLANKINDGVDEALPEINNGNADTVYHAFVDHEAVNYLIAAMMGMSDDMVHWVLDSDEYQDAYDNLGLTDIDLAYLDALFTFPAAALAEVQGAITLADLHQDDVPTYGTDYDLYMQDTTELLDNDAVWGFSGQTLEELTGLGGEMIDVFDEYVLGSLLDDDLIDPAVAGTIQINSGDGFTSSRDVVLTLTQSGGNGARVVIAVMPPAGTTVFGVEERIPAGLVVTRIDGPGAVWDGSKISWVEEGLYSGADVVILSYDVIASEAGPFTLDGEVQYNNSASYVDVDFSSPNTIDVPNAGAQVGPALNFLPLTSTVSRSISGGILDMRFRNDSAVLGEWNDWSPWEVVADSKEWELSADECDKIVEVEYRDFEGNINAVAIDDHITYIATPPTIALDGDNPMTVECSATYTEPGATATDYCGNDLTGSVVISGDTVDTSIANSTYYIDYDVTDDAGNVAATVTRVVNVTDTIAPLISLLGDPTVNVECGDAYVDAGANVADDCDSGVTVVVGGDVVNTSVPATYTITYDATDASGNVAATVTRDVIVADNTAPLITLNGAATVVVECGDTYTDAGANVSDACDSGVTVVVSGDTVPDPATVGTYYIDYDATDVWLNVATTVTRTVNVVDTTPPTIDSCGTPITVWGEESYSLPDMTGDVTAHDNCTSSFTITQDPPVGTVVTAGVTTVTITVTDDYTNESTCTTTYTVEDYHPADLDRDYSISMYEAITYVYGMQHGPNSLDFATRALYLWQNGEDYSFVGGAPTLCWISDLTGLKSVAPAPDATSAVWALTDNGAVLLVTPPAGTLAWAVATYLPEGVTLAAMAGPNAVLDDATGKLTFWGLGDEAVSISIEAAGLTDLVALAAFDGIAIDVAKATDDAVVAADETAGDGDAHDADADDADADDAVADDDDDDAVADGDATADDDDALYLDDADDRTGADDDEADAENDESKPRCGAVSDKLRTVGEWLSDWLLIGVALTTLCAWKAVDPR